MNNIQTFGAKMENDSTNNWVLWCWIWKDFHIPIRWPALIVPILEWMKKNKVDGKIFLTIPSGDIAKINNLDPWKAADAWNTAIQYLQKFVTDIYPEQQDNIELLSLPEPILESNKYIYNSIIEILHWKQHELKLIKKSYANNITIEQVIQYCALNILCYLWIPHSNNISQKGNIIPIGWKKEKLFFNLLPHEFEAQNITPHIYSKVWQKPVYYGTSEDKMLADKVLLSHAPLELKQLSLHSDTIVDYKILQINTLEKVFQIYQEIQK